MVHKKAVLTGEHFLNGDVACAEGALAAGCTFFAGYPITPATEIAERMARRLPQINGTYIQMEDEIASMNCILGASWAGAKAMTSTSGPGFSLMMENYGLGIMMETPCVIVNVQRGGPSTGLPTLVGQADVMQTKFGSHGIYEPIALSPNSPQEMFDFTIRAFNLSEKYRLPVVILADEVVGHMTEKIRIPKPEEIEIYERRKPTVEKDKYLPYKPGKDLVPEMANAGEGYNVITTGLTHDEKGYPVITAEAQEKLVRRLVDKIRLNAKDIIDIRETNTEDAEVVVVSYGCTSRSAQSAVKMARAQGKKVGMLRLCTIWPFPEERIRKLSEKVKTFVVPEINYGQIALEVERCSAKNSKTILVGKAGGELHTPQEILKGIEEGLK